MQWLRWFLAALALLGGCAVPPPPEGIGALMHVGRLAVSVPPTPSEPARSLSAAFELSGRAEQGRLSLSTPIGTSIAVLQWSEHEAWLLTADRRQRYRDLASLSHDTLGESVPIPALFDWLRGQPWPAAPSDPSGDGTPPGFRQLGWQVDLSQLGEGRISAHHIDPPQTVVRVILDRP